MWNRSRWYGQDKIEIAVGSCALSYVPVPRKSDEPITFQRLGRNYTSTSSSTDTSTSTSTGTGTFTSTSTITSTCTHTPLVH